jgi:hypothetical protein
MTSDDSIKCEYGTVEDLTQAGRGSSEAEYYAKNQTA